MFFTNTRHVSRLLFFLLAALLLPVIARADASYNDGDVIKTDTVWEGGVSVRGVVFVPEGVTLTIMPGTTVRFVKTDTSYKDGDGSEVLIPGSGIRVEGKVIAEGSPAELRQATGNPTASLEDAFLFFVRRGKESEQ